MQLPLLIAILAMLFFGGIAIYFSLQEAKTRRLLKEKEDKYQHRLYETAILKEIQKHIHLFLNEQKLIEIFTASLENLLPYSTLSSLIIKDKKLILNILVKEPVNTAFISQVRENILKSLSVPFSADQSIEEKISGTALTENNKSPVSSVFNIPLIINEKAHAIINIASTHHNLYKEEDISALQEILSFAGSTLSHLEEALIREKGILASLIGSLEDGVFMVDINSQITAINKTAKDLLKLEKDDPEITDILSHLPSSYNFGDKIEKTITLNQKIEEKDVQYDTKSFNITITPVLDAFLQEPKVIGASFLIRDVTLEKHLSKMKDDFTNVIVHELRSPLISIKASTEMLNGQNNLTEEDKKRLINIINNQTIKMLDEVSTILDASKLDRGLFVVHKTGGDFKKTIEDTIESLRPLAKNKSINLVTHIDPFLPATQFDNYHIRRCVSNLLSNSFKFTPSGGTITVRAWTTPQASEKIFVSVSDTGAGIPKEKQHLLFSKFTQIPSAEGTKGTGLGLYIVKGIVEAHGGTISLESEPNQGTTITFDIPITSPLQESSATQTESSPHATPLIQSSMLKNPPAPQPPLPSTPAPAPKPIPLAA